MARFPKVPGAGPKSMNNPVYWTRMHLQNERYRAQSQAAVERFNERWNRLTDIQNKVANAFVDEVIEDINAKELEKLMSHINEMQFWNKEINENIDIAKNSHLSKYATRIKNVALMSIKLCKKYKKYSDIETVEYIAKEKMLYLNGEEFYYFG